MADSACQVVAEKEAALVEAVVGTSAAAVAVVPTLAMGQELAQAARFGPRGVSWER